MDLIARHHSTTDESPPWTGIHFKLPIDSDQLAEKLKLAYPNCRTLRERKHQATIEFFAAELQGMQIKDLTPSTNANSVEPSVSELLQDTSRAYSQIFSDRSRIQSASGCTSPSATGSVDSVLVERTKPSTSAVLSPRLQLPTTPLKDSHQFVWSAHDGRSKRPKTKRKMTMEERSAYKETRKRGACDKCRRQKGKCTHMIEEDLQSTSVDAIRIATKRRICTGMDGSHFEGLKSVKTEHDTNVHYLVPTQTSEFLTSISTQGSAYRNTNEPSESAVVSTMNDRQWEEGPQVESTRENSSHSPSSDHESSQSSSKRSKPTISLRPSTPSATTRR